MGCFVSTPRDVGETRRRPTNIGEVSVFVPGLRIPKPVNFAQSLGDNVTKSSVERLSALRNRIVVMAGQEAPTITRTRRRTASQHGWSCLVQFFPYFLLVDSLKLMLHQLLLAGRSILRDLLKALEEYLPVLLGLVKDGKMVLVYYIVKLLCRLYFSALVC